MKTFIVLLTLLVVGCCGGCATTAPQDSHVIAVDPVVNEYGDTAKEAQVRAWLTAEVIRIYEKKDTINDMFNEGQLTHEEYFRLLDECDKEKRALPQRAHELFN